PTLIGCGERSVLGLAVFFDLVVLLELLELLNDPVVLLVIEGDECLTVPAQDQDPVGVSLGLEDVVGLPFDLDHIMDEVAFPLAGLFVDQLDRLHLAVRFRHFWHLSLPRFVAPGNPGNPATIAWPPSDRHSRGVYAGPFPARAGSVPRRLWSSALPSTRPPFLPLSRHRS